MSLNPFPNLQKVLDICRGDESAQRVMQKSWKHRMMFTRLRIREPNKSSKKSTIETKQNFTEIIQTDRTISMIDVNNADGISTITQNNALL